MFNKKGTTLIESLFAFEIFITVLIMLTSLFTSVYGQEARLIQNYQKIMEKEGILSQQDSFSESIEMVLHS